MSNDSSLSAQEPALAPYVIVKNAARAIEFYVRAFGAKERYRLRDPHGERIGHAELELDGSFLMLADEYPDFGALSPVSVGGTPVSLHLYVPDVDAAVARAEQIGATVLRPAKDEFFGERTALLMDPFGHRWHLATRREHVTPEEMQKRWNEAVA
jgi:PhnB protein